jgi:translation initiation factor 1
MAKKQVPVSGEGPSLNTLGELLRQRGVAVADPAPPTPAAPTAAPAVTAEFDLTTSRKLIVRRERKGHGGKAVTVVDGLALPAAKAEALARAMRKALGCGSWVDEGRVVLQGDRADAAAAWLTRHGARQVTRGN